MSTYADVELTETTIENFIAFMTFIAKNDLWDDAKRALEAQGIGTIHLSTRPIQVVRKMITDELLESDRLEPNGRRQALVIAECGCGVTTPGPPTPVFPHGPGPGDAGGEAGPVTLPPDGGGG